METQTTTSNKATEDPGMYPLRYPTIFVSSEENKSAVILENHRTLLFIIYPFICFEICAYKITDFEICAFRKIKGWIRKRRVM